jgi:hypothetical protein
MSLGHASAAAGVTRELLERELSAVARGRGSRPGRDAASTAAHPAEQRGRPVAPPDVARVRRGERRRTGERGASAERELLRVVLHRPAYLEQVIERVGADQFRDPELQQIFAAMIEAGPEPSPDTLAAALDEQAVAVLQELLEETGGLEFAEKTIAGGLAVLHERELTGRMEEIDRLMPLADSREKDALTGEKVEIVRELRRLGSRRFKGFSPQG